MQRLHHSSRSRLLMSRNRRVCIKFYRSSWFNPRTLAFIFSIDERPTGACEQHQCRQMRMTFRHGNFAAPVTVDVVIQSAPCLTMGVRSKCFPYLFRRRSSSIVRFRCLSQDLFRCNDGSTSIAHGRSFHRLLLISLSLKSICFKR